MKSQWNLVNYWMWTMEINADCLEILNDSRIVCREHGSSITFLNPSNSTVSKILVDGCQILDGPRCDYLIKHENNNSKTEHFIELKGSDVRHAFVQLESTIRILGEKETAYRTSYVISSRSPLSSAEIQVVRLKFKARLQSDLIVKNVRYETTI